MGGFFIPGNIENLNVIIAEKCILAILSGLYQHCQKIHTPFKTSPKYLAGRLGVGESYVRRIIQRLYKRKWLYGTRESMAVAEWIVDGKTCPNQQFLRQKYGPVGPKNAPVGPKSGPVGPENGPVGPRIKIIDRLEVDFRENAPTPKTEVANPSAETEPPMPAPLTEQRVRELAPAEPDTLFLEYARNSFMARFRNQEPRWSALDWGQIAEVIHGDFGEAKMRWDAYCASTDAFVVKQRLSLRYFLNNYDSFIDGPLHDRKAPQKTFDRMKHEEMQRNAQEGDEIYEQWQRDGRAAKRLAGRPPISLERATDAPGPRQLPEGGGGPDSSGNSPRNGCGDQDARRPEDASSGATEKVLVGADEIRSILRGAIRSG